MRKIICFLILMCSIFALSGCGEKYECRKCDKTVSKAYYDISGEPSFCEDCAQSYWAPFDYENYRVKD